MGFHVVTFTVTLPAGRRHSFSERPARAAQTLVLARLPKRRAYSVGLTLAVSGTVTPTTITACRPGCRSGRAERYHNLLVRYAAPEHAPKMSDGELTESCDLPMIWMYSPMLDRLRQTDGGWRIEERYIGGSTTNRRLTPQDTSAAAMRPFLPVA